MPLVVLVCGSRYLSEAHYPAILSRMRLLPRNAIVVHGAAPGADTLGDMAAEELDLERRPYPAKWGLYGNEAGPIRNQLMLDTEAPDIVLAFHTEPGLGRGTKDMVRRATAAGVVVEKHILPAHRRESKAYEGL